MTLGSDLEKDLIFARWRKGEPSSGRTHPVWVRIQSGVKFGRLEWEGRESWKIELPWLPEARRPQALPCSKKHLDLIF